MFKVEGKMFALSALGQDPLRISLKCEPALAEQLRQIHPAVLPGYHLNKRHWNTVLLDGSLPDQLIKDMKTVQADGWGKVTPVLPPLPGEPF